MAVPDISLILEKYQKQTCSKTCIDNCAYVQAATAQGVSEKNNAEAKAYISAAILAVQIATRGEIDGKQEAIIDRQITIAETLRTQAKKYWDVEKALMVDACAAAKPTENYSAKDVFTGLLDKQTGKYDSCVGTGVCLVENPCQTAQTSYASAIHKADMANFSMRIAENRKIALEDRRWNRRYKSLQAMRGIYSGADKLFENAAQYAGAQASNTNQIINGALATAGFIVTSQPQTPTYMGRKEYSWGGDSNVPAVRQVFTVRTAESEQRVMPTTIVQDSVGGKDESFIDGRWIPSDVFARQNLERESLSRGETVIDPYVRPKP